MLGGQGRVHAIAADGTDMDMAEALGETIEERHGKLHRGIERPCVGYVETKAGLRQGFEKAIELDRVPAILLP